MTPPITVRRAFATDLRPLSELARKTYADAFGHSFRPSDLAAHLERELSDARFKQYLAVDTVLLAEHEDHLIGFLQLGAARPDPLFGPLSPGDAELRRVYVSSEHRNNGVGRRLIDTALEDPIAKAAGSIFLDVWEDNAGARRLYEKYGFTTIGKRLFKVESGAPAGYDLIMVRRRL